MVGVVGCIGTALLSLNSRALLNLHISIHRLTSSMCLESSPQTLQLYLFQIGRYLEPGFGEGLNFFGGPARSDLFEHQALRRDFDDRQVGYYQVDTLFGS
jgi:hypothetical protein